MPELKIGFIGAGKMATALASGFVEQGVVPASNIIASDVYEAARDAFSKTVGGQVTHQISDAVKGIDVLFLAVKPQVMEAVLAELTPNVSNETLIVSIAAGVKLSALEGALPDSRLIRVMPNTPCLVGEGACGFSLGTRATRDDAAIVVNMLSTVGRVSEVSESQLDAITGLSGSGPAYAFEIIEALSDGGVLNGLPRDVATQFAAQTLLGAAKMVLETGEHPGSLKDAVTSPGGTTIAGLHQLELGGVRAALMSAVKAATERSRELGE